MDTGPRVVFSDDVCVIDGCFEGLLFSVFLRFLCVSSSVDGGVQVVGVHTPDDSLPGRSKKLARSGEGAREKLRRKDINFRRIRESEAAQIGAKTEATENPNGCTSHASKILRRDVRVSGRGRTAGVWNPGSAKRPPQPVEQLEMSNVCMAEPR